jgi:hypothetical protein
MTEKLPGWVNLSAASGPTKGLPPTYAIQNKIKKLVKEPILLTEEPSLLTEENFSKYRYKCLPTELTDQTLKGITTETCTYAAIPFTNDDATGPSYNDSVMSNLIIIENKLYKLFPFFKRFLEETPSAIKVTVIEWKHKGIVKARCIIPDHVP